MLFESLTCLSLVAYHLGLIKRLCSGTPDAGTDYEQWGWELVKLGLVSKMYCEMLQ